MPCTRTSKLMRKSRLIHLLHLRSASVDRCCRRCRPSPIFAGAVPVDRDRQPHVLARLELGDLRLDRCRSSAAPCARDRCELLPDDRVGRADELGLRDVALERPAASGCRRTRCCLLRSGSDRSRSSRTSPSCRGCRAAAGRTSSSPFGTSSGGNVTGTVSMLERTPARPAVTQNDVPPRIDVMLRLGDRDVVEEEARRLARAPCRDRAGRCACRGRGSRRCCACPAFTPVANDAHAVGDSGECVVAERTDAAAALASFCMFGSLPSSIHFCDERAGPCRRSRG